MSEYVIQVLFYLIYKFEIDAKFILISKQLTSFDLIQLKKLKKTLQIRANLFIIFKLLGLNSLFFIQI